MAQVQARTASGLVEYTPAEQLEFNRLMEIIREVYERYGFAPIDTTVLELSEVLLAKDAGETSKEVYRFQRNNDPEGTDFTMRFDLTVPLARYVAQNESKLVFPFSRYAFGKVYRAERAQAGRFREFWQCDIDTIGSDSPMTDAQFPAVINEIFERFGFGEFTIRLNNRMVLNGFFEGIGLKDSAANVLRVVDKMEKISQDEFVDELQRLGLNDKQVDQVLNFTAISGDNDEVLAQLEGLSISNGTLTEGIAKLKSVIQALRVMEVPERRFKIDLKIARGLDYYTGTVYETVLNDYPQVGSVCSGGRYDDLAGLYTKTSLPGVGISIGLTRLFYALSKLGVIKAEAQSPARVMVMPFSAEQFDVALNVAATVRKAGINTVFYGEPGKVQKKMRYADKMGFTYVVQIGAREAENGEATIKDMANGGVTTIALGDLVEFISK
ncbi:MAG: histidine--tRNA ligase [Candidatus Saccharibacteria bacterium]